jgi:hypothetical protein
LFLLASALRPASLFVDSISPRESLNSQRG